MSDCRFTDEVPVLSFARMKRFALDAQVRGVAIVLIAALIIRLPILLWVAIHPDRALSKADPTEYLLLSKNFRAAYGDSASPLFEAGLRRPPGYPAFLAIIQAILGEGTPQVVLVQIAIDLLTIGLAWSPARRLGSARGALLAAWLIALDPVHISFTGQVMTETLFSPFLLGGMILLCKAYAEANLRAALLSGVCWGMAALIRPIALYFPAVLVLLILILHRRNFLFGCTTALVLLSGYAPIVGTWILRNTLSTGSPFFSTIQSTSLLYYKAAGAVAAETGGDINQVRECLRVELDRRMGPSPSVVERARESSTFAWEVIRKHPRGWIMSSAKGAYFLIRTPGHLDLLRLFFGRYEPIDHWLASLIRWGSRIVLVTTYFGLLAGACRYISRHRFAILAMATICPMYLFMVSIGPESWWRFRHPLIPFLAVVAGHGLRAVYLRLEKRRGEMESRNVHRN